MWSVNLSYMHLRKFDVKLQYQKSYKKEGDITSPSLNQFIMVKINAIVISTIKF